MEFVSSIRIAVAEGASREVVVHPWPGHRSGGSASVIWTVRVTVFAGTEYVLFVMRSETGQPAPEVKNACPRTVLTTGFVRRDSETDRPVVWVMTVRPGSVLQIRSVVLYWEMVVSAISTRSVRPKNAISIVILRTVTIGDLMAFVRPDRTDPVSMS